MKLITYTSIVASICFVFFGIGAYALAQIQSVERDVRLCRTPETCRVLSPVQYADLKKEIVRKVEAKEEFTVDEWQDIAPVMNKEIKDNGKMVLSNVTSRQDFNSKILLLLSK